MKTGTHAGRLCGGLLFFALTASNLFAADVERLVLDNPHGYTFDQLMRLGEASNLELQNVELDLGLRGWDRLAAYGQLMPQVNFSYGLSQSWDRSEYFQNVDGSVGNSTVIHPKSSSTWMRTTLSQNLFAGMANWARMHKALLLDEDLIQEETRALQEFRMQLKKAAHRVLAAEALLASEQALLVESGEQYNLAAAKNEVGTATELDVLQAEINRGQQQVAVEAARREHQSSWDDLALLLGAESGAPAKLHMDFEAFQPQWSEEDLLKMALQRPDVIQTRNGVEAARQDLLVARSSFLPSLDLSVSHSRSAPRSGEFDFEYLPEDYSNSVGVTLSLPVFQGFQTRDTYEHSRIELRKKELAEDQFLLELDTAVRAALAEMHSLWEECRLTGMNRELARRSLELERERYQLGLAPLLNVQSAEAVFRRAESDHLRRVLDFHDRLADLELAVGQSLQN